MDIGIDFGAVGLLAGALVSRMVVLASTAVAFLGFGATMGLDDLTS